MISLNVLYSFLFLFCVICYAKQEQIIKSTVDVPVFQPSINLSDLQYQSLKDASNQYNFDNQSRKPRQIDEETSLKESHTVSIYNNVKYYLKEVKDYLAEALTEIWSDNPTNDSNDLDKVHNTIQNRGQKIHKLIAFIKLIIIGIVLEVWIKVILKAISVLIQSKFLFVAFGHLILSAVRLFYDTKGKKSPAKVIYYEHANHQHHYDSGHPNDEYSDNGEDNDHGSYSSYKPSYWGRNFYDIYNRSNNYARNDI